MTLKFDPEQNFTCRSCSECCRRDFDIVLTEAERARYEAVGASRWFRESLAQEEGATRPSIEAAGSGLLRIRKRPDGVCGFLSPENRCRIHEELGASAKPLTCQMFPFSFDAVSGATRAAASFCCPTVVRNDGAPLAAQASQLDSLARRWRKAASPSDRPLEWVKGRPLDPEVLESMRWVMRRLLDLHEPTFSLRRNVRRVAALLEDWTRQRVLELDSEKFAEYVNLTGEFAATKPSNPEKVTPRVARFLFRGFFFASLAPWASRSVASKAGLRLRLRLVRLLMHVHGVGPAFSGVNFNLGRRKTLDIDAEPFFSPAYHVLRAAIENLGSGRRPIVDEISLAVGHLLVAEVLFLSRTISEPAAPAWTRAIMDAHDVSQADPATTFGRLLVTFAPPPSSLHLFGARANSDRSPGVDDRAPTRGDPTSLV